MRQPGSAAAVGGLFFPRSAELGLAVEDNVSPRILKKMICAGTRAASYAEARDAPQELAEVQIPAERVRRACGHVGQDLVEPLPNDSTMPGPRWSGPVALPT